MLLRSLDLLAITSTESEAIARIAIEALSLGTPVVTTNVNSLPEIVGDLGPIVEPGNVLKLTEAMQQTLGNELSNLAAKKEGPSRIDRRYNKERQLELTEKLFASLIN